MCTATDAVDRIKAVFISKVVAVQARCTVPTFTPSGISEDAGGSNQLASAQLRRLNAVRQQAGNRHRPNPTWHRSQPRRHFRHPRKIDVADVVGSAFYFVVAGIHDNRAGFDPVGFHQFGAAYGGYDDIGLAAEGGEVFGFAVGDGYGGVHLQEHEGHRFAEDDAAADDDGVLSGGGDLVVLQDFGDSERGGAAEAGEVADEAAERLRGDAVDVFF